MKTTNIVVIGSGASALAAVRELLSSKIEMNITVLDAGNQREPDQQIGLKSHFGSLNMYDFVLGNIVHKNMKPVVWPSASFGGLTRIWGAAIDEESEIDFRESTQFYGENENNSPTLGTRKIINRYKKVKKHRWKLSSHRLAIDSTKCTMCGHCLTGCPTGAIWFAGDQWDELENITIIKDFRVREILQEDQELQIKSYEGMIRKADLVFLAAGPIGTAQILMRSSLISSEIEFKDTQAIFFPALRLPRFEGERSFALSQLSAYSETSEGNKNYLQMYPDSRNISQSVKVHKPFIGGLVSVFWKYLSPFVLTGIIYQDSKLSPGLLIKLIDKDKFELQKKIPDKTTRASKNIIGHTTSIRREFGVLPLFHLAKRAEPGESYHFGSSAAILRFNEDRTCKIRVVDASSLPDITPGPITSRIMTNSRRIVQKTLQEFQ